VWPLDDGETDYIMQKAHKGVNAQRWVSIAGRLVGATILFALAILVQDLVADNTAESGKSSLLAPERSITVASASAEPV
jgi:hypothetical protein